MSDSQNILIDVTRLVHRLMQRRLPTGVDRVSQAYVVHYRLQARAVVRWLGHSFIFSALRSQILFERLLCPGACCARGMRRELLRGMLEAGTSLRGGQGWFLFNTGHSGLEQPGYGQHLHAMGVRPLFLVHDLIPLTHPEYCRPAERERHARRMNTALALAAGIITNSEATREELMRYAAQGNRVLPPTEVALLAPGMRSLDPGERRVAEPYFVMLSTIEPRKNHWLILQIWRRLIECLGAAAPRLVVIGQRGWECENVVDLLERCDVLRGFVTEISDCGDEALVNYLCHSQALLFPSFAEGYGMPLAEALAHGVPVLASNLPVFREIADDIPEYIDPLDGKRWAEVIQAYMSFDSSMRRAQLERILAFRVPTWSDHFERVDALLDFLKSHPL